MKQDVKNRDVIYYKFDGIKTIDACDNVKINFLDAVSEMENIDWRHDRNYIGFSNKKTCRTLQFIRRDETEWYTDSPIHDNDGWDGYYWGCMTNMKNAVSALRLFYEEGSWFESLNFVMRRHKPAYK